MICAVDIETQGLDATKYIIGCLILENKKKPEFYTNPKELYKRIIQVGISEAKRGKILNVYSHNAQYDTAGYIDLTDKHLIFYSDRPFIWTYKLENQECKELKIEQSPTEQTKGYKEIIKFLDTYAIYTTNLKEIGEMIKLPKMETPEELLKDEGIITPELIEKIKPYLQRDTEICINCIHYLKAKLITEEIQIKRLYTINQIAIQYMINKLKKEPETEKNIFFDKKQGITYRTLREEEIHSAYRGGRVEAFQTGTFKNITYIDCNSRYPKSLIDIECPNLKSERKTWRPKKEEYKEIIKKIGVSRIMIRNNTNTIGILPIRTNTQNYYPKENTIIIGTYTNIEIEEALKEGYELLSIEWSITYEKSKNPFIKIINKLYKQKTESKQPIERWFYKMMMNASIGKMAQHREGKEIHIDTVENAITYLKKNYEIIRGINETNYMYEKKIKKQPKPYYMPIIPTLVNAHARIQMYKEMKKIPQEDLLYTDTDSIMYKNNHLNKFKIGTEMGEFKIEHENQKATIYGRKTYSIGNKIKISGFNQKNMTMEEFEKGLVKSKQMITIKTTQDIKQVGKFITQERDLNQENMNQEKNKHLMKANKLFIDYDINDITYFQPEIEKLQTKNEIATR